MPFLVSINKLRRLEKNWYTLNSSLELLRQYSTSMSLDSAGPLWILRYSSTQGILKLKTMMSMVSTCPSGPVMFQTQVELNGSKKLSFWSTRLSSAAVTVVVERWLGLHPENITLHQWYFCDSIYQTNRTTLRSQRSCFFGFVTETLRDSLLSIPCCNSVVHWFLYSEVNYPSKMETCTLMQKT